MEALNNLKHIKNNWAPYKSWEQQQKNEEACIDVLKKISPASEQELNYAKNYGSTLINAVNIMDQVSINKSENALVSIRAAFSSAALLSGVVGAALGSVFSYFSKSYKNVPKTAAFVGYSITTLLSICVIDFLNAHYEKMATRIARFQTRNKELKDVKNFIVYSDAQITQAKQKAQNMDDVDDITQDSSFKESFNPIKTFKKSIATVKDLKKDYADYKKWHKAFVEEEKNKTQNFKNMEATQEQLEAAQKDRDKILKVIKRLEISSNNYEINTDLGIRTISVIASMFTIAGGLTLGWALGRLSKNAAKYSKKTAFLDYMSKLSVPAGILSMIFLAGPLVKIAKESARIGRHKEKTELLKDASNFIAFSDSQKNSVKDTASQEPEKKSAINTVAEDFCDITKIKKDFEDYNKYKNSQLKEELKLRAALKDIPVTQKQMEDAEKLQKQVFRAFETIDDKSESFVDDTDAAVESISRTITGTICTAANLLTLKLFGNKISAFTSNKKMPGFMEGLKLTRNLKLKDLALIFIAPFFVTRLLILGISVVGSEIKKKACKIGVMTAANDLHDPKNFIVRENKKKEPTNRVFKDFIKV